MADFFIAVREVIHINTVKLPKEGELYKKLKVAEKEFIIYYGYYDEYERQSPIAEPIPIYPDFTRDPQYTEDGHPLVTKMQDSCKYYKGKISKYSECGECIHFAKGDEFIGICTCEYNQRNKENRNETVYNGTGRKTARS